MALLSLRGFDTPSLTAQGGQRLPFYFNIDRDIPPDHAEPLNEPSPGSGALTSSSLSHFAERWEFFVRPQGLSVMKKHWMVT